MKNLITMVVGIALLTSIISCGPKEIPADSMAKIMMKMLVDKKTSTSQNPKDIANDVVSPYSKAEGFSADDFKFTAEMYDKDMEKAKGIGEAINKIAKEDPELGKAFTKVMLEEELKAQGMDAESISKMMGEFDKEMEKKEDTK
ncbi:hypothetical protein F9K33_02400 [bacterium]|nr:MAG: hypothetical protein F9K33_02400 [bacterium]MBL7960779.1 hypothetical protein [bacterium]